MSYPTMKCKRCNKEFKYNSKEKNRMFCSLSCGTINSNLNRNYDFFKGNKNPSKRIEIRKKISKKLKGRNAYWLIGNKNPNFGKSLSESVKRKLSESHKGLLSREKHWNWKGGITNQNYGGKWTKELRTTIRKRDGFCCFICKKNGFSVHHIDYNKRNNEKDNLVTLCRKCHGKTNYNRIFWNFYFNQRI